MNIKEMESTTLSTINELVKSEKPFVAATLCYVMIERCLKIYLWSNRKALLTNSKIKIDEPVGVNYRKRVKFQDYANKTKSEFIGKFLNEITLGGLEILFGIRSQIKDARNKLIHSSFYLETEKDKPYDDRQIENWKHYKIAAEHLSNCSKKYFKESLIIKFDETTNLLSWTN